jgi:hypothetical protein
MATDVNVFLSRTAQRCCLHVVAALLASVLFEPSALAADTIGLFTACVNGLRADINGGVTGSSVTRIVWYWGDGAITAGPFPQSHPYASQGRYTVQVVAYFDDGSTASSSQSLNVGPGVLVNCLALSIAAAKGGSVFYQASVGSGTVTAGSPVTLRLDADDYVILTANPAYGNSFSGWSATPGIIGPSGPFDTTSAITTAIVTSDSGITADFDVMSPPTGIRNDITFSSVADSGPCGLFLTSCFSIQQNFYMSTSLNPGVPAYWVQNFLVIQQSPLLSRLGLWLVFHEYQIWTASPSGGTLSLIDCSGTVIANGTKCRALPSLTLWSPRLPGLELVTTIAQSSISFAASGGITTMQTLSSSKVSAGSSILAATTATAPFFVSPWEPQLMLVGWGNFAQAEFQGSTAGTVSTQFQFAQKAWQLPGTQYANNTCSSTGEKSSGLYWTVPVGGSTATFNTLSTEGGQVAAQGVIFAPAPGVDNLAYCH